MNDKRSDENLKARIEAMTMQERQKLVEACERVWAGTGQEWMAQHLRSLFAQAKRGLN